MKNYIYNSDASYTITSVDKDTSTFTVSSSDPHTWNRLDYVIHNGTMVLTPYAQFFKTLIALEIIKAEQPSSSSWWFTTSSTATWPTIVWPTVSKTSPTVTLPSGYAVKI
jgi:hypothetical protein